MPQIEISEELYNRLSKLAIGFDTPEDVIARVLDERENKGSTPTPASLAPVKQTSVMQTYTSSLSDTLDLLKQAFQRQFDVTPRAFGQKASILWGFSDDAAGVQWNVILNLENGKGFLGVNLEGMKYRNWPITTLLLNENEKPTLPTLSTIEGANSIFVYLTRDAWQAAARPQILEKQIQGSGTKLVDLNNEIWSKMVQEALSCLDESRSYRARKEQIVTLVKSNEQVSREVSPHLSIRLELWEVPPETVDGMVDQIKYAYSMLSPVHQHISNLCLDDESRKLFTECISEDQVGIDSENPIYTSPRSYGVYKILDPDVRKPYRQGNHPIRYKELVREFGGVDIIALYLEKDLALERARFENDGG